MHLASLGTGLVNRLVLEDSAGVQSDEAGRVDTGTIPTLIIWGEDDDVLPVVAGHALHARMSGSEMRIVLDARHVPHWERPEEFNGLVLDFLRCGYHND